MWEVVDKMVELGITPDTRTYTAIISRFVSNGNFELALQFLLEMNSRGLVPELKAAQGVILLATKLGFPRLALDLAVLFEEQSTRKLDPEVWMNCLIASAQELYVSNHLVVDICSLSVNE
jgi:pentatricopeptide repeat protein